MTQLTAAGPNYKCHVTADIRALRAVGTRHCEPEQCLQKHQGVVNLALHHVSPSLYSLAFRLTLVFDDAPVYETRTIHVVSAGSQSAFVGLLRIRRDLCGSLWCHKYCV